MAVRPGASLTLGALQYATHTLSLTATLTLLPGVNGLRVSLPAGVRFEAVPDDMGMLELDSGDEPGAGVATVLTGKVRAIRRHVTTTEVVVGDAGAELARLRPCATFEQGSAREAIRALADSAAVTTAALDLDLPLAAYVAHQGRTAAEHIAYLAELGGAIAGVNGDGELFVRAWPEGQPELALRYGRELLTYEVVDQPEAAVRRLRIGAGTAGSASAPDVLRPGREPLPADAPAPGPAALWMPSGALRVPKAATTASAGAEALALAAGRRLRAQGFLMPKLRPGLVLEVQDLPGDRFGGPWIMTRVVHHLRPGQGGHTSFEALSGEGGGLGSLLGAALAALGGLFA